MPLFSIKLSPSKENFMETATAGDRAATAEHFSYYQQLLKEKKLVFAGRCNNAHYGIALFNCSDQEEMEKLVLADPAIVKGVFNYTVDPFSIALLDPEAMSSFL